MIYKVTDGWIPRDADAGRLHDALGRGLAVLLTGPRQAGKTALVRRLLKPERCHVFDLLGLGAERQGRRRVARRLHRDVP